MTTVDPGREENQRLNDAMNRALADGFTDPPGLTVRRIYRCPTTRDMMVDLSDGTSYRRGDTIREAVSLTEVR